MVQFKKLSHDDVRSTAEAVPLSYAAAKFAPKMVHGEPVPPLSDVFSWVPTEQMFVDEKYGRPLSEYKVHQLLSDFDWNAIGVLLVGYRPGEGYPVLDGSHRKAACEALGRDLLPCRVYRDLTPEQEAALYVRFASVHGQTALDRFRARIAAGEERARDIQKIVQDEGKHDIPLKSAFGIPGAINCVDTCERIYEEYGRSLLVETMRFLAAVWPTHESAWSSPIVSGLSLFLWRYHDNARLDRVRLARKLAVLSPELVRAKAVMMRAQMGRFDFQGRGAGIGQAFHELYNEGLRASEKLPPWVHRRYSEQTKLQRSERMTASNRERRVQRQEASTNGGVPLSQES